MIALLGIVAILCLVWLYQQATNYKDEPPMYPGALPLIGHAHLLIGDSQHFWNLLKSVMRYSFKVGGVLKVKVGPPTLYFITDHKAAATVANTCLSKSHFYDFAKNWVGDGLFTSKADLWKSQRKALSPAFNQAYLNNLVGVFNATARKLVKDLEAEVSKGPFNQWPYVRERTMESICFSYVVTTLGDGFDDHTFLSNSYFEAVNEVLAIFIKRGQNIFTHNWWLYSWTHLKKTEDKHIQVLHNMTDSVIKRRKSEKIRNLNENKPVKTTENNFKPLLDLLLELLKDKQISSEVEVREHMDSFLAAGYDTAATTLTFTLMMLGSHPEAQDKMFRELEEIFGNEDRDIDKNDLCKLVYTEAVIKETLRLLPSVPAVLRAIDKDVRLDNCVLHAGSSCLIFLYGINHDPVWGEDVEEFKPERWLNPSTLPEQTNAFFSIGKRNCLGRTYALMAIKTKLAHVVRRYKLKSDWTKLQVKFDVVLRPIGTGHYITVERR